MYSYKSSILNGSTYYVTRVSIWTRSSPTEELILPESGREADRKWRVYNIQLSIAIMVDCTALLSSIVQSRERARARRAQARASYSAQWEDYTSAFNHSASPTSPATSASHSEPLVTHSSNGRPRTSRRLEKPAQFAGNPNAKRILLVRVIEEQFEASLSNPQKKDDDLSRSSFDGRGIARMRSRMNAELHGCNTVQSQGGGKKPKSDRVNRNLVKATVSSTSRQQRGDSNVSSQAGVGSVRAGPEDEQQWVAWPPSVNSAYWMPISALRDELC